MPRLLCKDSGKTSVQYLQSGKISEAKAAPIVAALRVEFYNAVNKTALSGLPESTAPLRAKRDTIHAPQVT
jgi:hypothetical protein